MHSTPNFEQADPRPVLGPQQNERLASDEQTVREELARASGRLSSASHGAGPDSLGPSLDPEITSFRAASVNDIGRGRFSLNGPAARGLIGALLVACIAAAAFIWQSSYGYAARLIIAQWTPALISGSTPAADKSDAPSPPDNPPTVQTTATDATAPQPAAQTATQDAASPAASAPPEQSQSLQTMAHDLADAQRKIAELRSSQEQLARNNAATVEQLKAAQQQIARLTTTAKLSEPNPRPKPVAPPRRPIAAVTTPVHQPVSTVPPPPHAIAPPMQASAQPQAPAYPPVAAAQPQGEPTQLSSAPRPPMPVPQ
jgi:hypothetical protein